MRAWLVVINALTTVLYCKFNIFTTPKRNEMGKAYILLNEGKQFDGDT